MPYHIDHVFLSETYFYCTLPSSHGLQTIEKSFHSIFRCVFSKFLEIYNILIGITLARKEQLQRILRKHAAVFPIALVELDPSNRLPTMPVRNFYAVQVLPHFFPTMQQEPMTDGTSFLVSFILCPLCITTKRSKFRAVPLESTAFGAEN